MFSTGNHFQVFNPGSVDGRRGAANPDKWTNEKHQNNIKLY